MSQSLAPYAENAKTFTCTLCGFNVLGAPPQMKRKVCVRCRFAGLNTADDVKARTMPKCRVEHNRPVTDDGDALS